MPFSPQQQQLQRLFKAQKEPTKALPPFPALFDPIKEKFPDLADALAEVEKNIAEWVKTLQIK